MNLTVSPRIRGFTLLEIMVALSIAMLIMAVGVPAFVKASRKEGLRKAVSDLVEGCSDARAQAILHGVPFEVVIQASDRRISVAPAEPESDDDAPAATGLDGAVPITPLPAPAAAFSREWPQQVGFKLIWVKFENMVSASEARVRFYPNGTADEFMAVLVSPQGETKVSVDVVTGLADSEPFR